MSAEKRRWVRVRPQGLVSRTGKVILNPKAPAIDCTVIDMSVGGACLELGKAPELPQKFEFLHGGVKRKCNLAWRRGFRIGIRY